MDFDFSDEQKMLRDEAHRFLGDVSSFASIRRHLETGSAFDRGLWARLGEMGWLGVAVAEEQGGLGFGPLELCVLNEELGRCLAPVPFFSTVCIAAEILKGCTGAAAARLLRRIVGGQAVVTLASAERSDWNFDIATRFAGGKVSGSKTLVADLPGADALIVTALDADKEPLLLLVDALANGVMRTALQGLDALRPQAHLVLDQVDADVLARGDEARQLLARVHEQAAIFAAFEQIGGAQGALDMIAAYGQQRYAFGRPIAGNQAVKHKLADMLVKIELARSNAYYGAWSLEAGPAERPVAAAAARLSAIEAFEFAAEENLHLHGGIGYTWEADCQFYYRRSRLLAVSLGNAAQWSQKLLAGYSRGI
ncbi:MAG: acyl-CoA dehydrogenase [Hydrocarboniphaga sp.]|uniref:acyl-CoA dehydrogenase family protein n=1 Tax=Hydrocarboniphaga sp. TaxID=2033016 RepID=UPI0026262607|nr:acyl-CoA dehydrogenase family protein [Hydrocarboniphaga sp.]MDB5969895.1 acyl-CoA dehydrogenase [Hydrocarboniphaga sp.]